MHRADPAKNITLLQSRRFTKGWITFGECFTGNGASPTNHCWCHKTRVIALSCGIKICTVPHLVLSQYTHLTDRRTELRQQYRALHYIQSHGKNTCACRNVSYLPYPTDWTDNVKCQRNLGEIVFFDKKNICTEFDIISQEMRWALHHVLQMLTWVQEASSTTAYECSTLSILFCL